METKFYFCPKCGDQLFIDDWNGWRWTCVGCEYIGGEATEKQIDDEQKWYIEAEKQCIKNEGK